MLLNHHKYKVLYLLLLFILITFACNNELVDQVGFDDVEKQIRKELNVPDDAKHVLILSHAAHMDWDWLNPFPYNSNLTPPAYDPTYFNPSTRGPADSILHRATNNLLDTSYYYYSLCEVGFLKGFAQNERSLFDQLKTIDRFRVVGGGITSPDNLLPQGEAFLRNFLVANKWMSDQKVDWSGQVWIPDDFGHDGQLPVMLKALDAMGVGFARIPGACDGGDQPYQEPKRLLLDTVNGGVDFLWTGNDGSEVIAHWLESHYNQGEDIDEDNGTQRVDFNSPEDISEESCEKNGTARNSNEHIRNYIGANLPVSPTPYVYVHVSDDFMLPYQMLVYDAEKWNNSDEGYKKTGVYVVDATFDHYIRLVNAYRSKLKKRTYNAASNDHKFQSNPYWMGFYASRPELKILHNEASRALLKAETFQYVANSLNSNAQSTGLDALLQGWNYLAPSTHHDYITGTAVDEVYQNEQIPLLKKALNMGDSIAKANLKNITSNVSSSTPAITVFNQLGYDNQGVIKYIDSNGDANYVNVTAPSLGYKVNDLSTAKQGDGSLSAQASTASLVLKNKYLEATIDIQAGGITSVVDLNTQQNILSGKGNEIVVYNDDGNIYRFAYETESCSDYFYQDTTIRWDIKQVFYDTASALAKSVTIVKGTTIGGSPEVFVCTYGLRQGEPYLRISTKGQLPENYTAMVRFPLSNQPDQMEFGTPYHWDTFVPISYGDNPQFNTAFMATHDFVVPQSNGKPLAAIYQGGMPAWTYQGSDLYGVILRNTLGNNCTNQGATGTDAGTHTQHYALRIPTGLQSAATLQPLKEARTYHTPMVAVEVANTSGGSFPASYSLASVEKNAIITTAKAKYYDENPLVLRVYQASNSEQTTTLNLAQTTDNCGIITALEKEFKNTAASANCQGTGKSYKLTLPHAVATFELNN
ncbi:MAG: hypothetical protein MI974_12675 [Chitinophagales bacterium]|nr:hypothetical protein [Chitinophagales bacterium]